MMDIQIHIKPSRYRRCVTRERTFAGSGKSSGDHDHGPDALAVCTATLHRKGKRKAARPDIAVRASSRRRLLAGLRGFELPKDHLLAAARFPEKGAATLSIS